MILNSFGSRKKTYLSPAIPGLFVTFERISSEEEDSKLLPTVESALCFPPTMMSGEERGHGTASATKEARGGEVAPKNPQEVIQSYKPEASTDTGQGALRLPDKIMAILVSEEAPDAIWWLQKGTAFAMQKEKFQEQILDKHFRGNKFKSLVRNLHRWGFKRMTCDSSPAGKTIAFSHKCFRKDKPELVKLIHISKDKEGTDRFRDSRMQELGAALPLAPSPPAGLVLSSPSNGPLREEGLGVSPLDAARLLTPQPSLSIRQPQPPLASLATAEHHHNLTSHGPESLWHSLSSGWKRATDPKPRSALPSGLSLDQVPLTNPDHAMFLARMGLPDPNNREQIRPSGLPAAAQGRQRVGSFLRPDGGAYGTVLQAAALDQQRRESVLQQHLAASDAQARLFLQQRLSSRASAATVVPNSSLFQQHPAAQALLPSTNAHLLAQLAGAHGGHESSLLLTRRHQGQQLQQQANGHSTEGSQRGSQPDGVSTTPLTHEELLYLAELRRRGHP